MKSNTFSIHLESNCPENWEKMSSTDTGRFCIKCSKSVVDFTNFSDIEIIEYFSKPQGKVCGRLNKSQIDRKYQLTQKSSFLNKKWIAGILLLSIWGKQQLHANNQQITYIQQNLNNNIPNINLDTIPNKNITINGKVVDKKNEPLIGCNIKIENSKISTTADYDGNFELTIPEEYINSNLVICYTGYLDFKTNLKNVINNQKYILTVNENSLIIGEVAVFHHKPKWYEIKYWFKKKRNIK